MDNKGVQEVILKPSDYIAGKETGIVPKDINLSGDFSLYLPTQESQEILIGNIKYETGGCTNFSELNVLETIGNFKITNKLFSEALIIKCKELGYIDENGKFNFSDRFLYKMSGTTQQGNQVTKGWNAIRKFGLVGEKMWPTSGLRNFEEFTIGIPLDIQNFALNFLNLFEVNYEWVVTGNCGAPDLTLLKTQLKQAPLQVIHSFCGADPLGIVQICQGCNQQHATMIYKIDTTIKDFDSVEAKLRELALNYPLIWVLKAVMNEKVVVAPPPLPPFDHAFYVDMRYGQKSPEIVWLQKALIRLGYKTFATGNYLDITRLAVLQFQQDYSVDSPVILWALQGKNVGPKTRQKLNQLLKVA